MSSIEKADLQEFNRGYVRDGLTYLFISVKMSNQEYIDRLVVRMNDIYGSIGFGSMVWIENVPHLIAFQEFEGDRNASCVIQEISKGRGFLVSKEEVEPFLALLCKGTGCSFETDGPTIVYNNDPLLLDDSFFRYYHSIYWKMTSSVC